MRIMIASISLAWVTSNAISLTSCTSSSRFNVRPLNSTESEGAVAVG